MRRLTALSALCVALAFSPVASAHNTGTPHTETPGWTLDPAVTLPLLATLGLFLTGWWKLQRRSRRGYGHLMRRARLFGAGWLVLAMGLVSPLHEAGERSFTAHMFEHELIMLVAAPLLVLSEPLAIMLWAFPARLRRLLGAATAWPPLAASWHFFRAPIYATLIQAAALWLWHAPALFDFALADENWHVGQHLSFLVSALLFWSAMFSRHTAPLVAALCLVVTSIVSGALGALMAFASSPWYAGYARLGMAPFGLSPAEDQQVAGLLMWVPGGLIHAGAALIVLRGLLRTSRA